MIVIIALQLKVTVGTGSFPGVKRPGRGADHPFPSNSRGLKVDRAIPLHP